MQLHLIKPFDSKKSCLKSISLLFQQRFSPNNVPTKLSSPSPPPTSSTLPFASPSLPHHRLPLHRTSYRRWSH
ncbi:hypothetical protein L484_006901 [Morus notabilis]|uniref:Uncharacterized protein n=1 Tax=Morus notabilis TaxID=981085 RepID=W9SJE9_9ROSA|nr:hypothetical protein L484_006901 [Morus notabilis]